MPCSVQDRAYDAIHGWHVPARSERTDLAAADTLPGIVVRAFGLYFAVQLVDGRELLSTVAGTLKRQRRGTDIVAVGDRVRVVDVGEGEGRIVEVLPRARALSRLARHTNDVEQVILANPDQALFLFAARNPDPHPRLLDRFLVMAESRELPSLIGINKMDLDQPDEGGSISAAHAMFDRYAPFYPTFFLSARSGQGLSDLRQALHGKVTAVAGPSGVGKSSLLNALDPTRERLVGEISGATGKGRHTTTATVLHRVEGEEDTYLADTPGIRALSLQGIDLSDLDELFPEFAPYLGACRYVDCAHLTEPGCAILQAVAASKIDRNRYESYAALRRGDNAA
ncbi:MAG: ribosome small subunit-dependent GTPase A [Thermomicrobiales bacterium]|nr:ribosome small subunit-dependent GTPase A [Thermomicrobiales bacterium]